MPIPDDSRIVSSRRPARRLAATAGRRGQPCLGASLGALLGGHVLDVRLFGSYGYGFFEEEARRRVVRVRVLRTWVGLRQLVLLF